jgi:acetyl esterase/lipase
VIAVAGLTLILVGYGGFAVYSDGSMKKVFLLLACLVGIALFRGDAQVAIVAPSATKPPAGPSGVVVLWPEGAPGAVGTTGADIPKMYVYPAATGPGVPGPLTRKGLRSAVIVMPGGGYRSLMMEKEGGAEARWLSAHGVTAFVLQYRLGPRYHFPAPMEDGARAVRYVRSHAAEYGVAKDRIGVWGFSAGGHLAGYLATMNDGGDTKSNDPVERVSDRPDFAIICYGRLSMDPSIPRATNMEGLLGDHPTAQMLDSIWVTRRVTSKTSPSFIYSTTGDQTVNSLNATAYYDAMKRAGAPVELHIFERGGHGTGLGLNLNKFPELAIYPLLVANWMEMHGWMAAAK